MLNSKNLRTVGNIAGILFFLSIPLIFLVNRSGNLTIFNLLTSPAYLVFCAVYLFIYYLNRFVLVRKFYLPGKLVTYLLSLVLLLTAIIFLKPFDKLVRPARQNQPAMPVYRRPPPAADFSGGEERRPPAPANMNNRAAPFIDIISIFLFIMVIGFGLATEMNKQWRLTEKRALHAETEKAHAELSFLKAQINPHFLFNTLNNIYSLAVTKSDDTADAIMKLSRIMRYVTDEVNEETVSLEDEVDCIMDYISLQQLRLAKKATINFTTEGDLPGKSIPPLLLMTFVENAFKHGISNHEAISMVFNLSVDKSGIHFFTQNKLFNRPKPIERRGIGITNTKDRLALLYPGKHTLEIKNENELFTVQLDLYY